MKRKVMHKSLSCLLAAALVVTTFPLTALNGLVAQAATAEPMVIRENTTLIDIEIVAPDTKPAITIEGNVTLTIKGTVTLKGGNGKDSTGGGAGIYVPEGSSLTIVGDSSGTNRLIATGGNGENGKGGGPAGQNLTESHWTDPGQGGEGGAGAGAGIGGNGSSAADGSGANCGSITIDSSNLSVTATGGNSGRGGGGGAEHRAQASRSQILELRFIKTAGGGGGGGGGGYPGAGIGGGGAKGGKGGAGGEGVYDQGLNFGICGGPGGGGGGGGYDGGAGGVGSPGGINHKNGTSTPNNQQNATVGSYIAYHGQSGERGTANAGGKGGERGYDNHYGGPGGFGNPYNDRAEAQPGQPGGAGGKCGNITIKGGTVTAYGGGKSDGTERISGMGNGGGVADKAPKCGEIIISGGSVKTDTDAGKMTAVSNGILTVYPVVLPGRSSSETKRMDVKLNGVSLPVGYGHPGDTDCYLYLPKGSHKVSMTDEQGVINYEVTVSESGVTVEPDQDLSGGDAELTMNGGTLIIREKSYSCDGVTKNYNGSITATGKAKQIIVESGNPTLIFVGDVTIEYGEGTKEFGQSGIHLNNGQTLNLICEGNASIKGASYKGYSGNAGIHVPVGTTLNLSGGGYMYVKGHGNSAAIGGEMLNSGNHKDKLDTFSCGTVTVDMTGRLDLSTDSGAGIGSGGAAPIEVDHGVKGGYVTINNGFITFSHGSTNSNKTAPAVIGAGSTDINYKGSQNGVLDYAGGTLIMNGGTIFTYSHVGTAPEQVYSWGVTESEIAERRKRIGPFELQLNGGVLIATGTSNSSFRDAYFENGQLCYADWQIVSGSDLQKDYMELRFESDWPEYTQLYNAKTTNKDYKLGDTVYTGPVWNLGRNPSFIMLWYPISTPTGYHSFVAEDAAGNSYAAKVKVTQNKRKSEKADVTVKNDFSLSSANSDIYIYKDHIYIDGIVYQLDHAKPIELSGTAGSMTVYGGEHNILMKNLTLNAKTPVMIEQDAAVTLDISGSNTMKADNSLPSASPLLTVDGKLTLKGSGSLSMEKNAGTGPNISGTGVLEITSGLLSLKGAGDTSVDVDTLTVTGGTTTASGDISSKKQTVDGGSITCRNNISPQNSDGEQLYKAEIPLTDKGVSSIQSITYGDKPWSIGGFHTGLDASESKNLYLWLPGEHNFLEVETDKGAFYYSIEYDGEAMQVKEVTEGDGEIDLSVSGAELHEGLYWYNGNYHLYQDKDYVITGTTTANQVVVHQDDVNLTLDNVTANLASGSPVSFEADVNGTLILKGKNDLTSGDSAAVRAVGGSLTIKGDGYLNAKAATTAAAIGGGFNENGADITILGGTLTLSGYRAIGGGLYGENGEIRIDAGSVKTVNCDLGTEVVNSSGTNVRKIILPIDQSSISSVQVDGKDYSISYMHESDNKLYLYVPEGDHTVTVLDKDQSKKEYSVIGLRKSITGNGELNIYYDDGSISDMEVLSKGNFSGLVPINDGDMLVAGTKLIVNPASASSFLWKDGIKKGRYTTVQTKDGLMLAAELTADYSDLSEFGWETFTETEDEDKGNASFIGWSKEIAGEDSFTVDFQGGSFYLAWKAQGSVTGEILLNGERLYQGTLTEELSPVLLIPEETGELTVRFTGSGTVVMTPPITDAVQKVNAVSVTFGETFTLNVTEPVADANMIFLYQDSGCTIPFEDLDPEKDGVQFFKGTDVYARFHDTVGGYEFVQWNIDIAGAQTTSNDQPYTISQDGTTISAEVKQVPYYEIIIPETVAVSNDDTKMEITASELKNMQTGDTLDISVGGLNENDQATLTRVDADNTLNVPIMDKDKNPLKDGDIAAQFTDNNLTPAKGGTIYFGAPVGERKAGDYTGTVTFTIAYQTAGN